MEFITQTNGGGGFFKPADYAGAQAFLIEPKKFREGVAGKFGPRDMVDADVTVFTSAAELNGDADPVELLGTSIEPKGLVSDLKDIIGKAAIFKLSTKVSKTYGKEFYVWQPVDPAVQGKVADYAKKREEKRQAAKDGMPEFLK